MKSLTCLLFLLCVTVSSAKINLDPRKNKEASEPDYLRASSINANILYLSPIPGSRLNSSSTNIIIRTKGNIDQSSLNGSDLISASGSESGFHICKTFLSDDGKTISVEPEIPFIKNETVTVALREGMKFENGSPVGSAEYSFRISPRNNNLNDKIDLFKEGRMSMLKAPESSFTSTKLKSTKLYNPGKLFSYLPSDYPQYSISSSSPENGYIFLDNFTFARGVISQPYLLILDNSGNPFFYKKMRADCWDFKLQPNGLMTYFDGFARKYFAMDSTFSIVDSFYCKNGYSTDPHELRLLPDGHALLIGDDYEPVDMSQVIQGGNPNAQVLGIIIQELDKNKNVVFQWSSWDHYKITDAASDINLTADSIDCVHTNAIENDTDGNIIISNRHMDELTKINRQTGDIMWRMGGKENQFSFEDDPVGFSHQHAIRRLPNGDIILFDNGNLHTSVMLSRVVEYKVDEANLRTNLVWQFRNNPDEYSFAMGYGERLDNGNTFIGWGATSPSVTEVSPAGEKVFELTLPQNVFSYRAYRFQLGKQFLSAFVPQLRYPVAGTHIEGNYVNLSWYKNKLAQNFHLQVATDTAFFNLIYDNSNLSDTAAEVHGLQPGNNYYWRVSSNNNSPNIGGFSEYSDNRGFTTSLTAATVGNQLPQTFELSRNFPNPFNPMTKIEFEIPKETFVRLDVYDILGQKVKELVDGIEPAGYYQVDFDAKDLPSGIYIYRLDAGQFEKTMKMIVMK